MSRSIVSCDVPAPEPSGCSGFSALARRGSIRTGARRGSQIKSNESGEIAAVPARPCPHGATRRFPGPLPRGEPRPDQGPCLTSSSASFTSHSTGFAGRPQALSRTRTLQPAHLTPCRELNRGVCPSSVFGSSSSLHHQRLDLSVPLLYQEDRHERRSIVESGRVIGLLLHDGAVPVPWLPRTAMLHLQPGATSPQTSCCRASLRVSSVAGHHPALRGFGSLRCRASSVEPPSAPT
jgi:hypothetical protein